MSQDYKEKIEVHHSSDKILELEDTTLTSLDDHSLSSDSAYVRDLQWTEEEEKKIVAKLDRRLMSYVLLMTFVLNMDRTNISNAISDNLPADLGFTIDGINTATLAYAIVFTLFTIPTNVIVKRVGAHFWIPFIMSAWGIVTWSHIFIKDFTGYLIVRLFIAATEAGFIPACLTYLTGFYKTNELATRLAWYWGIQSFASAFSGLLSFVIFRLAGVAGLEGWKWLFLIDGILTNIVGALSFFYLPANLTKTDRLIFGKKSWFNERETQIAVTRVIRDDLTKNDQYKHVTWEDFKISILDTKLWVHLIIAFLTLMPITPIGTYLPTIIKQTGFSVYIANLLAAPTYIVGLFFSILIARCADKYGNTYLWAQVAIVWALIGALLLEFLPDNTNKWVMYFAAFVIASTPLSHGMHIAWMSSNLAPIGKRTLALGWVIGAANICAVPGSQIYTASDSPRFHRGNWILIGVILANGFFFLFQGYRYKLTNKYRQKKWDSMTEDDQRVYNETTKHKGSNRLDYRFHL